MNDSLRVAICNTLQYLLQVALDKHLRDTLVAILVQKLGEILVAVLLNEVDFTVVHDGVLQHHNIGVVKLHENGNFSDSGGWDSIAAIVDMRALDGILFSGLSMLASIDASVSATPQLPLLNVEAQLVF